jgi:hypothetical protein
MPQANTGGHQSAAFIVPVETPRLLETAGGWRLVGYNARELGRVEGLKQKEFSVAARGGVLEGTLFYIEKLYWSIGQGLLYIQGAPLQRLVGPNYLVVSAERCSVFSVRPHIMNAHLALIRKAPGGLGLEEALVVLRRWSA